MILRIRHTGNKIAHGQTAGDGFYVDVIRAPQDGFQFGYLPDMR